MDELLERNERDWMKATFNEISVRTKSAGWARLLWEDTGRVIILSDYGVWSHYWGCIGERTLAEFLCDLDCHYMGKKMLGSSLYVHSDEETQNEIHRYIIEARKDSTFGKENAREEMDLLADYRDGYRDFFGWACETSIGDQYEMTRTEMHHDWKNFWDRLWVPEIKPILVKYSIDAIPVAR